MTISSKVQLLAYNLLEEGVVSVTGVDSGYPASRLYDRSLGFYCMYSVTSAYTIVANQNALALPVDTLVVEGHNLNGVLIQWQYSSNGSAYTTALSWTQSGNGQIMKQLPAPLTYQYWRLSIGSVQFQATEVFMGRAMSVPVVWDSPPALRQVADVEWQRTYGGVDHSIRIGPKRKARDYTVFMDRSIYPVASLRADLEYLDDLSKPIYVIDHEGTCFLAKFESDLQEDHMNEGILTATISVLEIPG
jgi:hypothetical protein